MRSCFQCRFHWLWSLSGFSILSNCKWAIKRLFASIWLPMDQLMEVSIWAGGLWQMQKTARYLLIQNELPLCQILWSDLCLRHWHNPQDCGLQTGKYHRGRVSRTEMKLVTFQTWKTGCLGHRQKGLKQPHYVLWWKSMPVWFGTCPSARIMLSMVPPTGEPEVLGCLLSIYPSNKWKSRFSWLLTLIIQCPVELVILKPSFKKKLFCFLPAGTKNASLSSLPTPGLTHAF